MVLLGREREAGGDTDLAGRSDPPEVGFSSLLSGLGLRGILGLVANAVVYSSRLKQTRTLASYTQAGSVLDY